MTSPHHTGNRPARMSTTLSPAGHHKRGDRQAIRLRIGGWFGGTARRVVPAYLPDGA